jgi:hypothetical protein
MSEQDDALVLQLLAEVKRRKDEIQKVETAKWKTSCTLSLYKGANVNDKINIQTVSDKSVLIEIYAFILDKESSITRAQKELGCKDVVKLSGYSIADWKEDLKNKMNQLNLASKKTDLKNLEDRINALVTVDQRRKLELTAIQEELQKQG